MIQAEMRGVIDAVVRRARVQGYVVPKDVRDELAGAGFPDGEWKTILDNARESLHYRQGRYYYIQAISPRLQQQQSQQQVVFHAVRELIRRQENARSESERRQQDRVDFIQPAKLETEDGRHYRVLTRDLSPTGIRLLGNRSLLGQKIRVTLAVPGNGKDCTFLVRIVWSCTIGDDLFENGGTFLEMAEA